MGSKYVYRFVVILAAFSLLAGSPVYAAKERMMTGSYTGRKGGGGTFQREVSREPGRKSGTATWQNERGVGSGQFERTWDKNTGMGSYSSTETTASGKTVERSGTPAKTGDHTLAVTGTRTGPGGKMVDVNKTITKNEDGSRTVQGTFTGPEGKTMGVNKTIQKTETGRTVVGDYSTSGGKSGTFTTDVTKDGSGRSDRHTEVTNQAGKTGTRGTLTLQEQVVLLRVP